jgi:hypothetical protein
LKEEGINTQKLSVADWLSFIEIRRRNICGNGECESRKERKLVRERQYKLKSLEGAGKWKDSFQRRGNE